MAVFKLVEQSLSDNDMNLGYLPN